MFKLGGRTDHLGYSVWPPTPSPLPGGRGQSQDLAFLRPNLEAYNSQTVAPTGLKFDENIDTFPYYAFTKFRPGGPLDLPGWSGQSLEFFTWTCTWDQDNSGTRAVWFHIS